MKKNPNPKKKNSNIVLSAHDSFNARLKIDCLFACLSLKTHFPVNVSVNVLDDVDRQKKKRQQTN